MLKEFCAEISRRQSKRFQVCHIYEKCTQIALLDVIIVYGGVLYFIEIVVEMQNVAFLSTSKLVKAKAVVKSVTSKPS